MICLRRAAASLFLLFSSARRCFSSLLNFRGACCSGWPPCALCSCSDPAVLPALAAAGSAAPDAAAAAAALAHAASQGSRRSEVPASYAALPVAACSRRCTSAQASFSFRRLQAQRRVTSWEQPSEEHGPSWHSWVQVCGQPGSWRWHVLPQHRRPAGSASAVTSRQTKSARMQGWQTGGRRGTAGGACRATARVAAA